MTSNRRHSLQEVRGSIPLLSIFLSVCLFFCLFLLVLECPVDSAEAIFLASRIVTGSPWPSSAVDPTWRVAERLGKFFDTDIPKPQATTVANAWALAAHAISTTVCLRWWALLPAASRAALAAAGHIVPT